MANKFINTPTGTAVYPHISKEDPRYGGFKVNLEIPLASAEGLMAQIEEFVEENFRPKEAKTTKRPYTKDPEKGTILLKFDSKYQPKVFDARGNLIDPRDIPQIWGGSELRVNGGMKENDEKNSVKIYLNEVQVVKLVSGGGGGGGFGAVEGGYVHQEDDNQDRFDKDDAQGGGFANAESSDPLNI